MIWTWPDSRALRVIDGDSLIAQVTRDLGSNGTAAFTQRLRLERINTPKITSPAGRAARDRVVTLVDGLLLIETTGPYKYGDEWMAEITLADKRNLSDLLVSEGLAVYWNGSGPRPADG